MQKTTRNAVACALTLLWVTDGSAEVITAADDHFVLSMQADSPQSPTVLWDRLINPAAWWHPDHTYSGDAGNLTLEPHAGGQWREDWDGGSVRHGTVLLMQPPRQLRLDAPFGPLQAMAVEAVWTITIEEGEGGTRVRFDVVANGSSGSNLQQLAPAVDAVKSAALERLVQGPRSDEE